MGIWPQFAEAIIREHQYRPLTGRVVTVGRQSMLFTPTGAVDLFRKAGAPVPNVDPNSLEIDTETSLGDKGHISDRAFFGLLGVDKLRSLDHDAYEGADLIHDLNKPLPDDLVSTADVIVDGSTIDNVFNPAQALMNLSRMLKPGGRLFSLNVGSNYFTPYMIPTPAWFFDFFVVNKYVDCKVYACLFAKGDSFGKDDSVTVLTINPETIKKETRTISNVETQKLNVLFVMAEKGNTDPSAMPIQMHYQTVQQHDDYLANLSSILQSSRPDILFSDRPFAVNMGAAYRMVLKDGDPLPQSILNTVKQFLRKFRLMRFIVAQLRAR